MKTKILLAATVALLVASVAGAQQQQTITLTPATAQALRNNAYNFATCASIMNFFMTEHPDSSANTPEMQKQISLAAVAGTELFNWVHLSKEGDALDPPTKKFTQAQLMADYGAARSQAAIAHMQQQIRIGGPRYGAQIVNQCLDVVFPQQLPVAIDLLKAAQKSQQP